MIGKHAAEAADRVIGELEENTGITDVTKVILGLPLGFLSPTGEIRKEIRLEIKELMRELDLRPAGFVPIYQAIIHKLHHDEGVPPSIILLGINHSTIAVSLYKIGVLAGIREIEKTKDMAASVEESLKSFTDQEVLPARMYLYGSPQSILEEAKSELLRHSWTATVSFLHFPKIDVVSDLFIVDAISLAGASELGQTVDSTEEEAEPAVEETPQAAPQETAAPTSVSPEEVLQEEVKEVENPEETEETEENEAIEDAASEDKIETGEESDEEVTNEVAFAKEAIAEDFGGQEKEQSEDANVVMVDAESLGFKKNTDVLEEQEQLDEVKQRGMPEPVNAEPSIPRPRATIAMPKVDVGAAFGFLKRLSSLLEDINTGHMFR